MLINGLHSIKIHTWGYFSEGHNCNEHGFNMFQSRGKHVICGRSPTNWGYDLSPTKDGALEPAVLRVSIASTAGRNCGMSRASYIIKNGENWDLTILTLW